MKLLTDKIIERAKVLGMQDNDNPVVIAKFFEPRTGWKWYLTAIEDGLLFGFVTGLESEWGYFSIEDLEEICAERDKWFEECRFKSLNIN